MFDSWSDITSHDSNNATYHYDMEICLKMKFQTEDPIKDMTEIRCDPDKI